MRAKPQYKRAIRGVCDLYVARLGHYKLLHVRFYEIKYVADSVYVALNGITRHDGKGGTGDKHGVRFRSYARRIGKLYVTGRNIASQKSRVVFRPAITSAVDGAHGANSFVRACNHPRKLRAYAETQNADMIS